MHEVVRHREREVAADRSRGGFGRVRRAHRRPHDLDRALALEDERERRPGRDELDELAEERLLDVLGVVAARRARGRPGRASRPRTIEPPPLEAREDLAGEPALHRVGLDQDESLLGGQRPSQPEQTPGVSPPRRRRLERVVWRELDGTAASTGVSQYGHTCHSGSSGALQRRHASFSFVVQTGQARKSARRPRGTPGSARRARATPPSP